MTLHTFVIHGKPVPKGRHAQKAGRFARVVNDDKTVSWEGAAAGMMAVQWDGRPPLSGPLSVVAWIIAERPKAMLTRKHGDGLIWRTIKPDADNCLKSVCDALTKGGVIVDDKHVSEKRVFSLYSERDRHARVVVVLAPIDHAPLECPA